LAVAAGLRRDWQVTVVDRYPELPSGGAALTVFPNGAAALADLGVDVSRLGAVVRRLRFCLADGRPLFTTDLDLMARRSGHPVRSVPRVELLRVLARDVDVRWGSGVVSPQEIDADLLVGADGARSVVRRELVSSETARVSGWMSVQALLPGPLPTPLRDGTGWSFVGEAGLCGLLPAGPELLQWWCDLPVPSCGVVDLEFLRREFGGYAAPVRAVLDRVQEFGTFVHVTHEVLPQWGSGAVTLVGDAAHAVPPTLAQGANQALDDAWALTRALRGVPLPDVPAALRALERRRVPQLRRMSRLASSERTNRVPDPLTRFLAPAVPASMAGWMHWRMLRSWSAVLG